MQVIVKKLTDEALMRRACEMTTHGDGKKSAMTLAKIYDCEHSPMRTQLFWIELLGIPSFVSVHLVRHGTGIVPFVMTNRDDRGGDDKVGRMTLVKHAMLVNAQHLINMSRKRLCFKAHKETRDVMEAIRKAVGEVDPDLARFMVKECQYRKGCHEPKSCGWWEAHDGH